MTAAYDRHSYDPEKRTALDAWGRRLDAILGGKKPAEVVPLVRPDVMAATPSGRRLAGQEIVVPSAVADEIRREGPNDPAVSALESTAWLKVVEAPPTPTVVQGWDLGAGESAVLTWVHAHPGTLAIVDDLAGRRCAAALRIPVRSTLGLVLTARQRG